jgi:hypothetical protein
MVAYVQELLAGWQVFCDELVKPLLISNADAAVLN